MNASDVKRYVDGVVPAGGVTKFDVFRVLRSRGVIKLREEGNRVEAVFSDGIEVLCVAGDRAPELCFFAVVTKDDLFLLGSLEEVVHHLDRRGGKLSSWDCDTIDFALAG